MIIVLSLTLDMAADSSEIHILSKMYARYPYGTFMKHKFARGEIPFGIYTHGTRHPFQYYDQPLSASITRDCMNKLNVTGLTCGYRELSRPCFRYV